MILSSLTFLFSFPAPSLKQIKHFFLLKEQKNPGVIPGHNAFRKQNCASKLRVIKNTICLGFPILSLGSRSDLSSAPGRVGSNLGNPASPRLGPSPTRAPCTRPARIRGAGTPAGPASPSSFPSSSARNPRWGHCSDKSSEGPGAGPAAGAEGGAAAPSAQSWSRPPDQ